MAQLAVVDILERYATVGPDFLTWLCVHAMREDLPAPPSEPGLQVSPMGPMIFASESGEATKITFAGDEAAAAPEVQPALRQGKRVIRSKFEFKAQDLAWTFVLDGETFDLRSVKLPVPKVPDINEYISIRVQATQQLALIVRELFEVFLTLRVDGPAWRREVEGWRQSDS